MEKRFKLSVAVVALAIGHSGIAAVNAMDGAKDGAQNFYKQYLGLRATGKVSGILNPGQLAQLGPLLTPQLRSLFSQAFKEQTRCRKLFPEDIPPWVDGDIFTSSAEGFTSFTPTDSKAQANARTVSITFNYAEKKSKVQWTDTVSMREVGGVWLVDDVFYRATFAFTSGFGSHLQGSLKELPAC